MTSASLELRPVPTRPGAGSASMASLVSTLRRCWRTGGLTLVAPDGAAHRIEGREPGPEGVLEIRNVRLLRRVLASGDIGFAAAFVAGEAETPDLARLLTALSSNFDDLARILAGAPMLRLVQSLAHALKRNSRTGSRRNIRAHYDLGDDFYRLWLDPGMNYSSALFASPGQDLAAAQREKHLALARAIDLRPGHRLLEIGCGWGDFARFAAVEMGAQVTAITISPSQHAFASRRIQAEGLAERVSVELRDYRDVDGRFDRIASIEMLEAVGEAYWPLYAGRLKALLAPGARAGLQVITIRDALFENYRRRPDFIQLHIFPGGMLPSEARLRQEMERAGLAWLDVRRFGQDYAETMAEWGRRFQARADEVSALGFHARFQRLWRYYLAYCEAGFRTGRTDVIQLVLGRE
jgi:cyclopropane-fatty-acyl-phospholipid synthase